MSNAATSPSPVTPQSQRDSHAALLRIDHAIAYHFRRHRWSIDRREQAFDDARAATRVAWHGLRPRGKDPLLLGLASIVHFACRGVENGRALAANRSSGRGAADLPHSEVRRSTGLRVLAFDDLTGESSTPWQDWLASDQRFGPTDEAAVRIDLRARLALRPARERRDVQLLAQGLGTREVADYLHVSPTAVGQDRRWLARSWQHSRGELASID